MRRSACRVDSNQAEIVCALRAIGVSVQPLHSVGQGCPDLLAGCAGVNVLLEVKDSAQPPSKRRLSSDESLWHSEWKGQVSVVSNITEAIVVVTLALAEAKLSDLRLGKEVL